MACLAFLSFGFAEILMVGLVALLVFGGDLPDVMRALGRSYGKLRRSLSEFTHPVRREMYDIRDLPDGPPPPVGPPTSRPPVPEYPEPDTSTPTEDAREKPTPASGSAADEPPPV